MTKIPVEVSARHVHLTSADWQQLLGPIPMVAARPISQPGQFATAERLHLRGPKGELSHVAILGPARPYSQVELAATDARRLGITPPLSESGKLERAAHVTLIGPKGQLEIPAAIIQRRHLHASPDEASALGLTDGQEVSLMIEGPRGARLDHVLVRTHLAFSLRVHLDTDEANACGVTMGMTATLVFPQ